MQNVYAACSHNLNGAGITYVVGETNVTITNTVTVERTGSGGDCGTYFIGFSDGGASSYTRRAVKGTTPLLYNLYKNSNSTGILKAERDITSNSETFFGTISDGQTRTHDYYFSLPSISATSPPVFGSYTDTVSVRSYSGAWNDKNKQEDSFNLAITITVPRLVYLSLLSTGDVFDSAKTSKIIDFGELLQSEEQSFDVKIVSNAGFNLKVSSSNNGKLKNSTTSGTNALIDYEFYASNTLRSLASSSTTPVTIASGSGVTPAGGTTIPIRVKIGSVTNKIEGDYEDVVTVTIVATE